MRKIIFLIILLFAFNLNATMEDDLKSIQLQIESNEKELKKLSSKKNNILEQVTLLESTLTLQRKEMVILKDKLKTNNELLESYSEKIYKLNKEIESLSNELKIVLSFLLENDASFQLYLTFETFSVQEYLKQDEIFMIINTKILQKIDNYFDLSEKIKDLRALVLKETSTLNSQNKAFEEALSKYKKLQNQLNSDLSVLKKEEKNKKLYIEKLKKEEVELDKLIKGSIVKGRSSTSSWFEKEKTRLPMPLQGEVKEHFGKRYIEDADTYIMNKGVKIFPTTSGDVYSVAQGEVAYVGYFSGMENIIIISHDSVYYTVYSNIDEYYVLLGDNIQASQLIGKIDFEYKKDMAYLYFEIRKKEDALDPELWFKKS